MKGGGLYSLLESCGAESNFLRYHSRSPIQSCRSFPAFILLAATFFVKKKPHTNYIQVIIIILFFGRGGSTDLERHCSHLFLIFII